MKSYLFVAGVVLIAGSAAAQTIKLEPEAVGIVAPFSITNGVLIEAALAGATHSGRAVYTFAVTNLGQYAVVAEVRAPGATGATLSVNVDADPLAPEMAWDILPSTNFSTKMVTWRGRGAAHTGPATGMGPKSFDLEKGAGPKYFQLSAGRHQLLLKAGTGPVELRSVAIVERPAAPLAPSAPTGLHVVGTSP
ncbi:MAG TPA: hypothetical protein VG167_02895 [Verrucomicrobiae bacterium]|nr:hypothetical protein [Verrucomicrobiae bacterium]